MRELNLTHNAKGGSGTSGIAVAMKAQAKLLALTANEEKILDKQNTEFLGWNNSNVYIFIEKCLFFNILFIVPRAQELELEDHQSRLEQKLREKMAIDGKSKGRVCSSPQR